MKVLLIGRARDNDIILNDPYVSRKHAQLVLHDDGKIGLVDLNSTSGTYVNGHPISGEYFLQPGDAVKMGNTFFPWENYAASEKMTSVERLYDEISGTPSRSTRRHMLLKRAVQITAVFLLAAVVGTALYRGLLRPAVTKGDAAIPHTRSVHDTVSSLKMREIIVDGTIRMAIPGTWTERQPSAHSVIRSFTDPSTGIRMEIGVAPLHRPFEATANELRKKYSNKRGTNVRVSLERINGYATIRADIRSPDQTEHIYRIATGEKVTSVHFVLPGGDTVKDGNHPFEDIIRNTVSSITLIEKDSTRNSPIKRKPHDEPKH